MTKKKSQAEGEAGGFVSGTGSFIFSSSLPRLLPASVLLRDRHVLPITQFPSQLLSSYLLGQSTGFHGKRHRFPQATPFLSLVCTSDAAESAWHSGGIRSCCVLPFFIRESSLTGNVRACCGTEAQRPAVSPSPVRVLQGWGLPRTSFSEKETDYKRLLESCRGDSWQLHLDELKGRFSLTFRK